MVDLQVYVYEFQFLTKLIDGNSLDIEKASVECRQYTREAAAAVLYVVLVWHLMTIMITIAMIDHDNYPGPSPLQPPALAWAGADSHTSFICLVWL